MHVGPAAHHDLRDARPGGSAGHVGPDRRDARRADRADRDPARDLYERPADTFVARFLGESNLLHGTRAGAVADGRGNARVAGLDAAGRRRARRAGLAAGMRRLDAGSAGTCPATARRLPGARRRARLSGRTDGAAAAARERHRRRRRTSFGAGRTTGRPRSATSSKSAGTRARLDPAGCNSSLRGGSAMLNRRRAVVTRRRRPAHRSARLPGLSVRPAHRARR